MTDRPTSTFGPLGAFIAMAPQVREPSDTAYRILTGEIPSDPSVASDPSIALWPRIRGWDAERAPS